MMEAANRGADNRKCESIAYGISPSSKASTHLQRQSFPLNFIIFSSESSISFTMQKRLSFSLVDLAPWMNSLKP